MIRYFAAHPTAANLLMALMILAGVASLPGVKRETFPDFTPTEVEVRVPYPGASAEDAEEGVCLRIEDAVEGTSALEELRCEAREGVGVAVARMREGADFARFLDDVKTEVEAIDDFPEETEAPVVEQLARTDRVVSIAVSGPMSAPDLKAYAQDLEDRLRQLAEVAEVEIHGFSDHQLRVSVPEAALLRHGLSIADVADVIARQSVRVPAGTIETRERDLLVRFDDERRTPRELEELVVVGGESGAAIRLGEIATVEDRFELDEEKVNFDGARAALLEVRKTKAQDILEAFDAIERFVARERARAAPGVELTLTGDMASIVADRLRMLVRNGWQGLLLVLATMWLFFAFRFAFWVVMGLPVSFLAGLFLMATFGYSVNMITMVALLIALGLLVDDAIVIAENVATELRNGRAPLDAAVAGTRQVLPGVVSSFLTTVAIFGPLAFLGGDIGKVLRVLPVVLLMVLAASLIEAFLILPNHLAHALARRSREPGRFRRAFDAGVERVRERVVGRAVDAAVAWRYPFTGAVIAIFLVSLGMLAGGMLKFRAFPELDGDVLEARILLPQGTPLARTEAVVGHVAEALERVGAQLAPRQPAGLSLVRHVSVRYGFNADAHETGPHVATVTADLLTAEVRDASIDEITTRWREAIGRIPDLVNLTLKEPTIGPAGLAIEIRLSGPDLDALEAASLALREWLSGYAGVVDLVDDLRPGKPELRLRLRPDALGLGIDAATVARQLRGAFFGITADEVQVGPEPYDVDVQLANADQSSLADLEDFRVASAGGRLVPLSAVATIEHARGHARIHRIDGRRTVTVEGDVDARVANAAEIISDTRARFLPRLAERFPSVFVSIEGQASESRTTGASLARGFVIGLVGIFLLLSFQFRSYLEPLVVMTAIPLALIGVVWGHLAMGLDVSMPSLMGFVSLAGIVVNDSILLVVFLKRRVQGGNAVADAARLASRERFRAVLLTSVTTIAGLLPLLSERSLQAQVLIPLVASVVFGLLATTLLVLLVVPALYAILDDLGLARPHRVTDAGTRPVPAS